MVDEEYGKLTSPAKDEVLVVVERSEPTVSCVPVAIRAVPFELETMIEFGENVVAPVPPFAIASVPPNDPNVRQLPARE